MNSYKEFKNQLLKRSIKAYRPKTTEPSCEGDEVVDYDELFENFDSVEFEKVFNSNHTRFYNTMKMCFIFFMSNYVWENKIYLSKPNILLPIMDDVLVILNLTRKDYINLYGNTVNEANCLKLEEYSYTGNLQSQRFKPYAIQIEKYFKNFRTSSSGVFFTVINNKE